MALALPLLTLPRYNGTIAMAYLCFIMFIVFFFALIVFQTAVSEELGIGEDARHRPAG